MENRCKNLFFSFIIKIGDGMGLFEMFKKSKNIMDTIDKSDYTQVFSACLGKMKVIQNRVAELVVKDRDWFVDFKEGYLAFGEDKYPVELIGTESNKSNTWNWGYNNVNHFPDSLIALANETYEKGKKYQLEALTTAQFEMDEIYNGHHLAIIACRLSKKRYCYYRGPHGGGNIFMAFSNIPDAIVEPVDVYKFVSICGQCLQNFTLDHKIFIEAFLQWNKTSYRWEKDKIIAAFEQTLCITFEKVENMYRIKEIKTI